MQIRHIPLLILIVFADRVATQSVQIPPLLQVEMARDPQHFVTEETLEKRLQPGDYITVGVEMKDGGDWQQIRDIGGQVNTRIGGWGTVRIPRSAVRALTAVPDLRALHYNTLLEPHNEEAIRHVQADKVHAGVAPLPHGYSGKDVVVGIIDTGIDYLHEDFRMPGDPGRSRIAYLWDQWSEAENKPAGFSYGAEWTRTQIETAIAARPEDALIHMDTFPEGAGHGTHVSGTAAGNQGMAYEADLIVVATIFSEASILDAANYILQRARQMGKPCVINLSLGSNTHAHDGTDFLSESLSRLVDGTEGVAIVASAGNDGHRLMHWGGFPLSNQPASVFYGGGTGVYAFFRIPKTDLPNFEMTIAVDTTRYVNGTLKSVAEIGRTPWLKLAGLGAQPYYQPFYYTNDSLATELYLFNVSSQDKNYAEFYLVMDEGWNRYNWTRHRDKLELSRFYVRGSGTFHAWFSSLRLYTYATPEEAGRTEPTYRSADTNFNLGSPCDGRNILCVGAYTNRSSWTDLDGQQWTWPPVQAVGDLANFSSTGPTMDGRIKPEIIAPGKVVASSVPSYNEYSIYITQAEPLEAVFSGTSMSSPVVAGAVALLFEENPRLTHEEIRNLITGSALQDRQALSAGPLPNGYWGYGKLDVYKAMLAALNVTATSDPVKEPAMLVFFPNPARQIINLRWNGLRASPGRVRLLDLTGRTVLRPVDLMSEETIQLDVSALPSGLYLLEWTDGEEFGGGRVVVNSGE